MDNPYESVSSRLTLHRFTRQGVPTPVQPDFNNLQQVWKTLNPTGVNSADYQATFTATVPRCPASTEGGWNVIPDAPLPTIGVAGVTPGMPENVPKGTISVDNHTSQTSVTYSSTDNPSSTSSSSASSATSEAAAGRTVSKPFSMYDYGFLGMMTALLAVCAGAVVLL